MIPETETNYKPSKFNWEIIVFTNLLTLIVAVGAVYLWDHRAPKPQVQVNNQQQSVPYSTNPNPNTEAIYKPFNALSVTEVSLSQDKYINWSKDEVDYSVTGAEYGTYKLRSVPVVYSDQTYSAGDTVTALVLKLKLRSLNGGCISDAGIRMVNTENDQIPPNIRQLYFPNSGGCAATGNVTYSFDIPFIVAPTQKNFRFSVNGPGLGTFIVTLDSKNNLKIVQ